VIGPKACVKADGIPEKLVKQLLAEDYDGWMN
jgi:hypothetical protein